MQHTFVRLDDALIERLFQPLADILSLRMALDRLRVAGLFLDAASIAWILSQAGSLTSAVTQWQAGTASLRAVLLLLGLVALISLRVAFRRVGTRSGANPLRRVMLPHRGMVVALLVARLVGLTGFAGAADLVMLGCAACALYLGACVSRPTVVRRSRWLATAGAAS
jgi:hypothetical protein